MTRSQRNAFAPLLAGLPSRLCQRHHTHCLPRMPRDTPSVQFDRRRVCGWKLHTASSQYVHRNEAVPTLGERAAMRVGHQPGSHREIRAPHRTFAHLTVVQSIYYTDHYSRARITMLVTLVIQTRTTPHT